MAQNESRVRTRKIHSSPPGPVTSRDRRSLRRWRVLGLISQVQRAGGELAGIEFVASSFCFCVLVLLALASAFASGMTRELEAWLGQ